jgi:hypothetical protein
MLLSCIMLALAIPAPAVFWIHGKRMLGSQTHPAALFILAWITTALLLGSVGFITASSGALSLFWVLISFGVLAGAGKLRRKPGDSTGENHP